MDEGSPICSNCNARDLFVCAERGEITCGSCGCVDGEYRVCISVASYKAVFDATGTRAFNAPLSEPVHRGNFFVDDSHASRRTTSAPYKRSTYFNERLTQWCQVEPRINDDDMTTIDSYCTARWGEKHVLTKEELRDVLWDIDLTKQRLNAYYKPYFVKKYLEKYLTIRCWVSEGVESKGAQLPQPQREALFYVLSTLFARLQEPFDVMAKVCWNRHSFVNYNFIFRRLLDLIDQSNLATDFPPLKNKRKRNDIILMWIDLIIYLDWPYINSDGANFGSDYETRLSDLKRRAPHETNRHKKHKRSHSTESPTNALACHH